MTKERAWPAKAMYILLAAALAISLMIMAAPAQKVSAAPGLSEWTQVDTPTVEDWVLAPDSVIMDYALAEGGDTAYAVVFSDFDYCDIDVGYYLLKSEDGAATWDDITDEDWAGNYSPVAVATDGVDADFVAVALMGANSTVYVSVSADGGDTFEDPELVDSLTTVDVFAVSPEVDDERTIAIGGGTMLYRATVDGDSLSNWDDATDTTDFPGWVAGGTVVEAQFSPSWTTDDTILVLTATNTSVLLQCGRWDSSAGWNLYSRPGFAALSMPMITGATIPLTTLGDLVAGIALPNDYDARHSATRIFWVWVNYSGNQSRLIKVDNDLAYPLENLGQIRQGMVWLTNISYWGNTETGKAIAGVLGDGLGRYTDGCEGVQVYRKEPVNDMSICCETWQKACPGKLPTGIWAMDVAYVSDDKAYAVALGPQQSYDDEGAWSVSFDDGYIWNQLSLIDTFIHYLSDVAVSPDCNKTFLVSVSKVEIGYPSCDSVWVHADTFPEEGFAEYSGHWLRTWHGSLDGDRRDGYPAGMLRLAPEETDGLTVYLFDFGTEYVYRNDLETLACWDPIPSTEVDEIVDIAVQDKDTIFALDANGEVAMYDFDEDEWYDAVESKVDAGWTIAVWGDWVIVGGHDGEVSYSDDGGETFTQLDDVYDSGSKVTVTFDTYFDTNMMIYAAVEAWGGNPYKHGGIYSLVIGADEEKWTDLNAEPSAYQIFGGDPDVDLEVAFTGLVVDRPDPSNPYTSPENGGVIYATYYGSVNGTLFTGVARSLEREITVCTTCLAWDFLQEGLTHDYERFDVSPDALKICGCLTEDSNIHLFAIDVDDYDICEGEDYGAVWTFEDCYAKKAPEPVIPDVEADPCSCYSAPFTVTWDTLCDACDYEIQFALDEAFTMPVKVNGEGSPATDYIITDITGDTPSFSVMGGEDGGLSCETTYWVRVRASRAATDQLIHSWWSRGYSFTVPPSVEAGVITLIAPAPGALNVPVSGVGFSWDLLATADEFQWVLSANADLSSPLDSKTVTSKAASYANTLGYATTYYWQVTAYNEGDVVGMSATGTFTTMAEPVEPPPVEEPGTPMWVWVVIAIGAVLVIVVIVLIFRTRRV